MTRPPLSLGRATYFLRGKLTLLLALYASIVTVLYLRLAVSRGRFVSELLLVILKPPTAVPPSLLPQSTGPSSIQQPVLHGTSLKHDGSCWCSPDKYCLCTPSLAIDVVLGKISSAS